MQQRPPRQRLSSNDVAHIHEQGNDLIIIPLESSFGMQTQVTQLQTVNELQMRANGAGLKGKVVPVWNSGGRMAFLAPPNWHAFFSNIDLQFVAANINRYISW
jgi:hypothetical protein